MELNNKNRRFFFISSAKRIIGTVGLLSLANIPFYTRANDVADKTKNVGIKTCPLTTEQIVGPYFVDYKILRRDITESQPGIPLLLKIKVIDGVSCEPVDNILVDIWHCNARGKYSGWSFISPDKEATTDEVGTVNRTDSTSFFRGIQPTDQNGVVRFTTIFPGFYAGRATHIHVAIRRPSKNPLEKEHFAFVGQLYFPEDLCRVVYNNEPYSPRDITRVTNTEDEYFTKMNGAQSLLTVNKINEGDFNDGFTGEIILSIDKNATSTYLTQRDLYKYTVSQE
ncbi:intradiol ring-cleavage dioxygenase [Pectobacterium aroidearum]|uniref:Intradiol ring-cleavage dioxygenase n=1 Tax=Pectobacterium aroidearum TaxID=1201031 RepID=A0AAW3T1K7_9GAMM|nr:MULTISPECIES: intradiol ring-cleavage dioxygenase [Pectobacterium]MBA0206476.1 intradiol ring-cleavage dioxygenase [Pectobacterium aroidearum]MBA5202054.1 intradiol ring-cleavage dioxygenase [Pectobacterium aroidearum]MBA5205942.1 intradiol ring-cleavage dioxygenase [Pectobacterium aroidearum]MBA5230466.1 intradiol ring-cleavage dioxygenase [Pectobacterium aroidearum]MBA5234901.1 intradiol ring-cleavage dioxygenase [Pectobacterium aroidearum]